MKIIFKFALFIVFLANVLHAQLNLSSDDLSAIESTTPLAMDEMPSMGNFYSAANPVAPPLPGNIFGLSGWNLGGGYYLLDDLEGSSGSFAMDDSSPFPPGFGGGGGGSTPTNSYPPLAFPTNGLWLWITNVANNTVYANLHGGTDYVYEVFSKTDLTVTNWNIETEVFPGVYTNTMPFTVPMAGRDNLFLWARDWTKITSNGNITPEWWFYQWFGTTDMSDYDRDYVGNTLAYDYAFHQEPNIIAFTLQFTNTYVNTHNVPARLTLFGGLPLYIAILVNDTNLNDAVWQPYTGTNISVYLGPSNGTYAVSAGLRGFAPNATVTWVAQQLLSLNAPTPILTVTSPGNSTVSQPMIQLQGLVSETLSNLTYDVSNSSGTISGQQGYWSAAFFDTNVQNFTTNTFQCFDVPVTNGLNTITLHATDSLGTTVTTNVNFTVDYSGQTNPPALGVLWPQDGTPVAGNNFTFQAQLDDDTATVTAQITDNNGNTTTLQALVERSGTVWVNNLPLATGTNTLTITAINAAGHVMTTNLTLIQSTVAVTMDPLSSGQLNQPSVTVTGTVSDPSKEVTVNNQTASVDDEGNWEADNVPISPTGTAIFDVELSGGSSGGGSYHFLQSQPPVVSLMNYVEYNQHAGSSTPGNCQNGGQSENINWTSSSGGLDAEIGWGVDDCYPANYFSQSILPGGYNGYGPNWEIVHAGGSDIYSSPSTGFSQDTWSSNVTANVGIYPSGQTPIGQKVLYLVTAQVFDKDTGAQLPGSSLAFNHQVPGTPVIDVTNDDNSVWSQFLATGPGGITNEVTPHADGRNIKFNQPSWQVTEVGLQIVDTNTGTILSDQTNTVIVGQQMDLTCQLSVTNALFTNSALSNIQWTVPGFAISNYVVAADSSSAVVVTNFPMTNSVALFYWVDGETNLSLVTNTVVQCSATINGSIIRGQAVFKIVKPQADIETQTGSVSVNSSWGRLELSFGTTNNLGIVFYGSTVMPSGFSGSVEWVQIANNFRQRELTNQIWQKWAGTGLDNKYPYSMGLIAQDNPGTPLTSSYMEKTVKDNFEMWFLFQPDITNSIYVPLRSVNWSWGGAATNSAVGWTLQDGTATNSINPTNIDTTTFPQWNYNITNNTWITE